MKPFLKPFFIIIGFLLFFLLNLFFFTSVAHAPNEMPPLSRGGGPEQREGGGVQNPITTSTPTKVITVLRDTVTPAPSPTPTLTYADNYYYTVQSGESLSEIANRYNLTVDDLIAANYLANPNFIIAGQQLLIAKQPITLPEAIGPEKQIMVILSQQKAFVYENRELLKEFVISSGVSAFPTVIGPYRIERKYLFDDMEMPGVYYLKNVPHVMYFYQGYSFHGAPWNHNLGTPQSHGCLNMSEADAEWLYDWAPIGTLVRIVP